MKMLRKPIVFFVTFLLAVTPLFINVENNAAAQYTEFPEEPTGYSNKGYVSNGNFEGDSYFQSITMNGKDAVSVSGNALVDNLIFRGNGKLVIEGDSYFKNAISPNGKTTTYVQNNAYFKGRINVTGNGTGMTEPDILVDGSALLQSGASVGGNGHIQINGDIYVFDNKDFVYNGSRSKICVTGTLYYNTEEPPEHKIEPCPERNVNGKGLYVGGVQKIGDSDSDNTNDSFKIEVLEIIENGDSQLQGKVDSELYEITTVRMKQFVAMREELDGKYDLIYIGHGDYNPEGTLCAPCTDGSPTQREAHDTTDRLNDITNLKADQIINEFIENNQPVVLSEDILKYEGSKLFHKFSQYKTVKPNNVWFLNGEYVDHENPLGNGHENSNGKGHEISNGKGHDKHHHDQEYEIEEYSTVEEQVKSYLYGFMGPKLKITGKPTDYLESKDFKYQKDNTISYTFNVENEEDITSKSLVANLYIDRNFDDKYSANEIVLSEQVSQLRHNSITYQLPKGYSGLRFWKLELVDEVTNAKDYEKGIFRFRDQPVEIDVLQVTKSGLTSSLLNNEIMNQSYLSNEDYKINIDVTDMNTFKKSSSQLSSGKKAYSHENINGKYGMVIFGFAHDYHDAELSNQAVESIEEFIDTNQSVIFTHDTISNTDNHWVNNFMDDTGQLEPLTNLGNGAPYPSNNTKKVNDALMSTFPFILHDNVSIASTHNQYYTLDLEDPNIIPWYNIVDNHRDHDDSWNNYFTYSKGNITYSGSGHTNSYFHGDEQQLFVNTMYRAYLGSNHAPLITVHSPTDNQVIPSHQDIELSYTVEDLDLLDKGELSTRVLVNGEEVENANVRSGEVMISSIDHGLPNGGEITITIEATDSSGATATKVTVVQIEKVEANLLVERSKPEQDIFEVDQEVVLNYNIDPRELEAQSVGENQRSKVTEIRFEETFPADVEVVSMPEGFTKEINQDGETMVTGSLGQIEYVGVTSEEGRSFEITVKPVVQNRLLLDKSKLSYKNVNGEVEESSFNDITINAKYAIESISFDDQIMLNLSGTGSTKNLLTYLEIWPTDAEYASIEWQIADEEVASVNGDEISATGLGTTTISVTVTDLFGNTFTEIATIGVRQPITTVSIQDTTVRVDQTKSLELQVNPASAIGTLEWTVDHSSLVDIDKANGNVTGLEVGTTNITVKGYDSEGNVVSDTASITIEPALPLPVVSIKAFNGEGLLDQFETDPNGDEFQQDNPDPNKYLDLNKNPEVKISVTGEELNAAMYKIFTQEQITQEDVDLNEAWTDIDIPQSGEDVLEGTVVTEFPKETGYHYVAVISSNTQKTVQTIYGPFIVGDITIDGQNEMKVNEDQDLTATIEPDLGNMDNATWLSSDNSVATVEIDSSDPTKAVVTAKKNGTVTITFSPNNGTGITGTIVITVEENPLSGIKFPNSSYTIDVGETKNLRQLLEFTPEPENVNEINVSWNSSDTNENRLALTQSGGVTGKSPGYVVVTAETNVDNKTLRARVLIMIRNTNNSDGNNGQDPIDNSW